jgi:hypothetical protein
MEEAVELRGGEAEGRPAGGVGRDWSGDMRTPCFGFCSAPDYRIYAEARGRQEQPG